VAGPAADRVYAGKRGFPWTGHSWGLHARQTPPRPQGAIAGA
jgi:hypothetical protein